MKKDPVGDELHRLREEFEKLVNNTSQDRNNGAWTTPEQIAKLFGLTVPQAKEWLNQEPNYSRRKVTRRKSSRRSNRTWQSFVYKHNQSC